MNTIQNIMKETRTSMEKALESARREFHTIHAGKASPTMLDTVRVEMYGTMMSMNQVAQVFRQTLGKGAGPEIIHMNPVFDSDHFAPRPLGSAIATVGLRDAEDTATMLGFARFAGGTASLAELETYLAIRTQQMLGHFGRE